MLFLEALSHQKPFLMFLFIHSLIPLLLEQTGEINRTCCSLFLRPEQGAGLRLSGTDLMAKICCSVRQFGLLDRSAVFGAAQKGHAGVLSSQRFSWPGCWVRRESPGSVLESPSLEGLKNQTDMALGDMVQWAWGHLVEGWI